MKNANKVDKTLLSRKDEGGRKRGMLCIPHTFSDKEVYAPSLNPLFYKNL